MSVLVDGGCGAEWSSAELHAVGAVVGLTVPFLPAWWPRCPFCSEPLKRLGEGVVLSQSWRCGLDDPAGLVKHPRPQLRIVQ